MSALSPARLSLAIGAILVALAAFAWLALVRAASSLEMMAEAPLTLGLDAGLFLATWVAMMAATMFPAFAPMVATYARVRAARGRSVAPTPFFVSGYLLAWTAVGAVAYAVAVIAEELGRRSDWAVAHSTQLAAVVLIAAGLYQLSPLKSRCLSVCRSPMGFILTSWHDGPGGALRMGLDHAGYCIGCCWLLFVALFPLGMMNLAALALLAALILVERTVPAGQWLGRLAGIALVAYGALLLVS